KSFTDKINDLMARYRQVDEDFFEQLEEVLILSNVGINTVMYLIEELKCEVKRRNIKETEAVIDVIHEKLVDSYYGDDDESIEALEEEKGGLKIYHVVDVNVDGKKVILADGDTFRAGAIEQLEEWGKSAEVDVIKQSEGSDPAAVIYDGINAARSRKADVLICDTAGRLQNKVNLMKELEKIHRIIDRE